MNDPVVNQTIEFHDWHGEKHAGRVKDVMNLSDDFGDFYLVWIETTDGVESQIELEDWNGLVMGDDWEQS